MGEGAWLFLGAQTILVASLSVLQSFAWNAVGEQNVLAFPGVWSPRMSDVCLLMFWVAAGRRRPWIWTPWESSKWKEVLRK